jgi:hypothetical protein
LDGHHDSQLARAATLQRDYFGASCLYLMYCLYLRLISNKHFFCCYFEALREQTAFSLLRHSAASDAIQLLNKQYKALCGLRFKLSRLSSTQAKGFLQGHRGIQTFPHSFLREIN